MSKRFRVCSLDQEFLLPPSLQDWLPQDHLARFIADVVNELDLSAIYAEYERKDGRGLSAYHPLLMTRLLLYGYCIGITSSRKIEKATYDNVAFRYLSADQHPDHDTLASFRQEHLNALASLFVQALQLCQKAGLVKLGNVAIDGTKIKANASTHRSVDYQKISEREQQLQAANDTLPVRKAGRPGKAEQTSEPPKNPRQREKEKKQRQRARKNAAAPGRQYNFVDPDSRVMRDNGQKCFVQAYNAQIAVDAHAQVIVAAELTQQTVDRQQLLPLVKSVCSNAQATPRTITADAGYWDTMSLLDPSMKGIEVLVSPDSNPQPPGAPLPASAPRNEEAIRMRTVLASEEGKARYALRKSTVEPVFGQIKEARGIRRFRLRGVLKVTSEWKLICATHNLLKLFRHRTATPTPEPGSASLMSLLRFFRCTFRLTNRENEMLV